MALTLRQIAMGLAGASGMILGSCGGRTLDSTSQGAAEGGSGGVSADVGGASTSVGGASSTNGDAGSTASGGLEPISPDELGQIQSAACSVEEALVVSSHLLIPFCTLAQPTVTYGCGSVRDATIDELSVVLVWSDGSLAQVEYSTPDCPNGEGYYSNPTSNGFTLCQRTCAALNQGSAIFVDMYARCGIIFTCIN